jgi:hypothetical protein
MRTDGHEANSRCSKFCERAKKKCAVSKEFQTLSPVCDYYSMARTLCPKTRQTKKRDKKKNSKLAHEDCFLLELCDVQGGSNMTGTICV